MTRRRNYSRLAKVEEKKNMRSAVFFGILSVGMLFLIVFYGLPAVAKFAGFLTDINQVDQPIEVSDTTPPAPPRIISPDEFTNKKILEVNGTAEAGSTVTLYLGSEEKEVVVSDDGSFTTTFTLRRGENRLHAIAKDTSGNESTESETYVINYDDKAPELSIISPTDGKNYVGEGSRQITVKGLAKDAYDVSVNDRRATLDKDGNFSASYTLEDGENVLNIKAVDEAGNEAETHITVTFSL